MWLWIAAALLSAFVKGLCGMGDAPVFTSMLAFSNDNIDITPVSLLVSLPNNLIIAWKERSGLKKSVWLPMSIVMVIASFTGILILKNADTRVIKNIFAVFIMFVGLYMLINELRHSRRKIPKIGLTVIGILSGLGCGLFAIGALLGAYVSQVTDNSHEFKSNLCMIFAIENTFRFFTCLSLGILTRTVVERAIMLYPFILIGLFAGMRSSRWLDERKAKILVDVMLIVSGAVLLIGNL